MIGVLAEFPVGDVALDLVALVGQERLGRLKNYIVAGPFGIPADYGAQPTAREEVLSTALGGDWEFRGIRPPARS